MLIWSWTVRHGSRYALQMRTQIQGLQECGSGFESLILTDLTILDWIPLFSPPQGRQLPVTRRKLLLPYLPRNLHDAGSCQWPKRWRPGYQIGTNSFLRVRIIFLKWFRIQHFKKIRIRFQGYVCDKNIDNNFFFFVFFYFYFIFNNI